ncbi:MAG: class I SAM-dependent methyltransferase [Caulobacteraceae bacterium]
MYNAVKRNAARLLLGGKVADVTRLALAARSADVFARQKRRVVDRFALYSLVSAELIAGRPFDYLEFGVFQGESIRKVAGLNPNPGCRFFGFDSFEGLPQDWNAEKPKGYFDVGGALPQVDDARVSFIKGWFDQTLPPFLADYRPHDQLWIHIDADLYGSTLCVLTYLNKHIRPGTVIVFDEVEDLMHEFKALCDFQDMSGKTLELHAATQDCRQAAFVCRG